MLPAIKNISAESLKTDHFNQSTYKINGEVYLIETFFHTGKYVYERLMCEFCGLKYTGAKIENDHYINTTIYCPICNK